MNANFLQIVLLVILTMVTFYDVGNGPRWFGATKCVFSGWITGVIFGNPDLGLEIGATMQLMSLGLMAYGGAAVPDYVFGTIVGTAVAIQTGSGLEYAIGFALPAGLLIMQLTIFQNILAIWFAHQAEKALEKGNYKAMQLWTVFGVTPRMLKGVIPLILCVTNIELINLVMQMLPSWLMLGLKVAGGLLPACGIAILLRYMDLKKFWPYCLAGFILAAYFGFGMIPVALCGVVVASVMYMNNANKNEIAVQTAQGDDEDEL